MIPLNYKVLIKDEVIEAKSGGGIFLPGEQIAREQTGSMFGKVVAMGPTAFKPDSYTYDKGKKQLPVKDEFAGLAPSIGDTITYTRHAGVRFIKKDGKFRPINEANKDAECYRLINDIDVQAIMESEA